MKKVTLLSAEQDVNSAENEYVNDEQGGQESVVYLEREKIYRPKLKVIVITAIA